MLSSMAGYDPENEASVEVGSRNYLRTSRRDTRDLRLGHLFASEAGDAEIVEAVDQAIAVLRRLTANIRDVALPSAPDLFSSVADPEAYAFHAPYLKKSPELYDPETRRELMTGAKVTLTDYINGRRDLDRLRHTIGELFKHIDLLVLPTLTRPPLKIADCRTAFQMEGGHTGEFNIFGLPAISVPCGFTSAGFPIGLQIVGPRMGEAKVLALARGYQRSTDWHLTLPSV